APPPAPYLLYCGRREPLKGTPLLLDYWAAYRALHPSSRLKFVLTGAGDVERPEGLEADIIDLGFVSEEDKHDLMAGALAFCHASVNESLGIVLLESWLASRPVLVFARGEVLAAQTRAAGGGLWFRNCAEFCECVDCLLGDPALSSALAASGRVWTLANYSAPAVTKRLMKVLEN
ncbi:MAG: glycosyltransferase family 4 protein, partial [Kiritimatiellae bacterium]|nr:glycosyltransferase family 4 protein [Kiritimatiellia bacterium]